MEPWPGASPGGTTAPGSRSAAGAAAGLAGRGTLGTARLRLPACPAPGPLLPACPASGTTPAASAALPGGAARHGSAASGPALRRATPTPYWPRPLATPTQSAGAVRAPQVSGVGVRASLWGPGGSAGPFLGYWRVLLGVGALCGWQGLCPTPGCRFGGVEGTCSAGPLGSLWVVVGVYGFSLGVRVEFAVSMGSFGGGGGSAGVRVPFGGMGSVGPLGPLR